MNETTNRVWAKVCLSDSDIYQAQEWRNKISPAMNGQFYTIIEHAGALPKQRRFTCIYACGGESRIVGRFQDVETAKGAAQKDFDNYIETLKAAS